MTPERHLVVLLKAPRVGAVKRRLARGVGQVAAWAFYRRTAARLLVRVGRDPRWRCRLAVTPDRFAREGRFWPAGIERLPQGPGDLGRRMARAMGEAPPGPVVLVGGDIPGLGAAHIQRAFDLLRHHDAVFGPATDGGYWLVGLAAHRRRLLTGLFDDVRWSTGHALADTLANLDGRRVAFLEPLRDVDTAADLEAVRGS